MTTFPTAKPATKTPSKAELVTRVAVLEAENSLLRSLVANSAVPAAVAEAQAPVEAPAVKLEKPTEFPEMVDLEDNESGAFMKWGKGMGQAIFVTDGACGSNKDHEPQTESYMKDVLFRDDDGNPKSEIRTYGVGKKGWVRNKKDTGWTAKFSRRTDNK